MFNEESLMRTLRYAIVTAVLASAPYAYAVPLGSDSSNPAVSGKDILNNNPGASDGFYWIDTDGPGGNAPFQAYTNMTFSGGGWTLGVHSILGSEPTTNDMVSNTGIADLSLGHTRNLTALAVDESAQIWHLIKDASGTILFSGFYTGRYHDPLPTLAGWTIFTDNGLLDYQFGRAWTTAANDNSFGCAAAYGAPWYYGSCWTVIPSNPSNGLTQGPQTNSGRFLGEYSIYVREIETPSYPVAVPEPSGFLLMLAGLVTLGFYRNSRHNKLS